MKSGVGFVGGDGGKAYGMIQKQSKQRSKVPKSDDGNWSMECKEIWFFISWLVFMDKKQRKKKSE